MSPSGREDHGALDHIFQFSDVARPGILLQEFGSSGSESGEFLSQFAVEVLHEFECERHDVFDRSRSGGMKSGTTLRR